MSKDNYTPREIGEFVANLPEKAEVFTTVSIGTRTMVLWTASVVAKRSLTGTPEPMRWGRASMLGIMDAVGTPASDKPAPSGSVPPLVPAQAD